METIKDISPTINWAKTGRILYLLFMIIAFTLIAFVLFSGLHYYLEIEFTLYFSVLGLVLLINIFAYFFTSKSKNASLRFVLNIIILITNLIHFGIAILVFIKVHYDQDLTLINLLLATYAALSIFECFRTLKEIKTQNKSSPT